VTRVQRWLLVAALAGWGAYGIARTVKQAATLPRSPAWAARLAPLAAAPIAPGTAVGLVVPAAGERATPLLAEAAWQRPDLRWTPVSGRPAPALLALVTLGDGAAPPGWRRAWSAGGVTLHERGSR